MSPRAGTALAKAVPTGSILLTHIKRLATHNAELGEISDAAVFIRGNTIEWAGPSAELPTAKQHADVTHDLSNHVVLPGLVNTHHHSAALSLRSVVPRPMTNTRTPFATISSADRSCCGDVLKPAFVVCRCSDPVLDAMHRTGEIAFHDAYTGISPIGRVLGSSCMSH